MANDPSQDSKKINVGTTKKAIIAFLIGATLVSILFYFFKNSKIISSAPQLTQDSFQGPAELSTAVQINCQESAKKIFSEKNCIDKETEYLKSAANCLSVYYSVDQNNLGIASEGNYGDIALEVAKCYSENEKSNSKAADWLKKIGDLYDWDIYMGPISCDSKSTLAAHVESYSINRNFKCIKTSDLSVLVTELKNKKFEILNTMLASDEVVHQGIIEADVSCPETMANIEKNINHILSSPFEVTEPKLESGAPDDVFIELTRNNERVLNLQFKIKADGCLHFRSLLAPSSEIE